MISTVHFPLARKVCLLVGVTVFLGLVCGGLLDGALAGAAPAAAARTVGLYAVVAVAFALVPGLLFARSLAAPIRRMAERMAGASSEEVDLTQTLAPHSHDELRLLADGFNRFLGGLKEIVGSIHQLTHRARNSALSGSSVARFVVEGSERQMAQLQDARATASALETSGADTATAATAVEAAARKVNTAAGSMQAVVAEAATAIGQVKDSIFAAGSSIAQITGAIGTINQNVKTVSEVSEEVASCAVELDSSVREITRFTAETAKLSEGARKVADLGKNTVRATSEGMDSIESHTRRVTETIFGLEQRSHEISAVLTVIRDVAEQTSLLALNAAIIASQAGEQGKGFNVVAERIRELAQRTRAATQEIANLITGVQKDIGDAVSGVALQAQAVTEGRVLAEKAAHDLQTISANAQEASSRITRIVQAVQEQSLATGMVLSGINRIGEMLTVITQATREQSTVAVTLQGAADRIREISQRSAASMEEQNGKIREVGKTVESMAGGVTVLHRQALGQVSEIKQLAGQLEQMCALSEGFARDTRNLLGEMATIETDVQTLWAQLGRFRLSGQE